MLGEQHVHRLSQRGGDVLADVVGADRQLPVAPVDQDGQLYRGRPAQVADGVQRGPHGPAGEQHVVDQHHDPAVHTAGRQLGATQRADTAQPQVVAVEGDVQ